MNYENPRILSVETIHRDKPKPYTSFSHCLIAKGHSLEAPPMRILNKPTLKN